MPNVIGVAGEKNRDTSTLPHDLIVSQASQLFNGPEPGNQNGIDEAPDLEGQAAVQKLISPHLTIVMRKLRTAGD